MAYQIKRQARITEDLELLGKDGEVLHTLPVDVNIDSIMREYRACEVEIAKAEQAVKWKEENAVEQLGSAIIHMYTVIFGETQTDIILAFFEKDYSEMMVQIMPFINDVITPTIVKYAKQRKLELKNAIHSKK